MCVVSLPGMGKMRSKHLRSRTRKAAASGLLFATDRRVTGEMRLPKARAKTGQSATSEGQRSFLIALTGNRTRSPAIAATAAANLLKIPALDLQRIDMKIRHLSRVRDYAERVR